MDRGIDRRGHHAGSYGDDLSAGPDNQYRRGRSYGRADNPTYDQPQALLTALEGGAASLLFSSGMAAAAAIFQSLPRDAHIVAPRVMYWGCAAGCEISRPNGASRWNSSTPRRLTPCAGR